MRGGEFIIMSAELKPMLAIFINLAIGYLASQGFVDPKDAPIVAQGGTEIVGDVIVLITVVYSLHRYVHLPLKKGEIKQTTEVKTESPVEVPAPVEQSVPAVVDLPPTPVPSEPVI